MAKLAAAKPQVLIDADIYDAQIVEIKEDHSDVYDKESVRDPVPAFGPGWRV